MRTKFVLLITTYVLAGCVHGTGEVIENQSTNSHLISSQYGLMGGGWSRASKEATEKAVDYCETKGKKYKLIKEEQAGSPGWSPLQSNISFTCMDAPTSPTKINGG